jgi:D-arabinose 1-dehydrogenase-like Zn-dependent alcohol dehydrogenase
MAPELKEVKVAIVGLGRVGTTFLKELSGKEAKGIKIVAGAETNEKAPGVELARQLGIAISTDKEIIEMGEAVDVIFDLTDNRHAKMDLRLKLAKSGNMHTVIAPEPLSVFVWDLVTEGKKFPR